MNKTKDGRTNYGGLDSCRLSRVFFAIRRYRGTYLDLRDVRGVQHHRFVVVEDRLQRVPQLGVALSQLGVDEGVGLLLLYGELVALDGLAGVALLGVEDAHVQQDLGVGLRRGGIRGGWRDRTCSSLGARSSLRRCRRGTGRRSLGMGGAGGGIHMFT